MKIILLHRDFGTPLVSPLDAELMADSAIVLPGRPLFLPDFDSEWLCRAYLCVRISRLGKNISVKFAPRYFDAVTVALRVVPLNISRALKDSGHGAGIMGLFDGALEFGEWRSPAENMIVEALGQKVNIDGMLKMASETVSAVSEYCTLKTGDVIMPCMLTGSAPVAVGDVHVVKIDGTEVLKLRVK